MKISKLIFCFDVLLNGRINDNFIISFWRGQNHFSQENCQKQNFTVSVSYTTRKPRVKEKNGVDYYFIKKKEFKNLIKKKKFLEFAKVFKNYYGSSKDLITKKLSKKKILFLILIGKALDKLKIINLDSNYLQYLYYHHLRMNY